MRPCNSPSQPAQSPWLRLKNLADDFNNIPDSPLSTLQDHYNNYKIAYYQLVTELGGDIDPYKLGLNVLKMADMNRAASMRNAIQEVLGLMP